MYAPACPIRMLPPLAIDPGAAANCRGCGYLLQLGCLHPLCPLRNGRRTYISAISVSPFCAADGNLFHQYVGPADISKGVIPSFENIYTDIFLAHRPRATASIVMKGCRCIRPQPCWVNGVTSPHRVLHLRLCYGTASWTCRPVVAALRFKSVHAGYIYQPRSCGYELTRIYRSQGARIGSRDGGWAFIGACVALASQRALKKQTNEVGVRAWVCIVMPSGTL